MCLPLPCFTYTTILTSFSNHFLGSCGQYQTEFSQMVYGILGRLRIQLPACVYQAIRTKFMENSNKFKGFDEDTDSE